MTTSVASRPPSGPQAAPATVTANTPKSGLEITKAATRAVITTFRVVGRRADPVTAPQAGPLPVFLCIGALVANVLIWVPWIGLCQRRACPRRCAVRGALARFIGDAAHRSRQMKNGVWLPFGQDLIRLVFLQILYLAGLARYSRREPRPRFGQATALPVPVRRICQRQLASHLTLRSPQDALLRRLRCRLPSWAHRSAPADCPTDHRGPIPI